MIFPIIHIFLTGVIVNPRDAIQLGSTSAKKYIYAIILLIYGAKYTLNCTYCPPSNLDKTPKYGQGYALAHPYFKKIPCMEGPFAITKVMYLQ